MKVKITGVIEYEYETETENYIQASTGQSMAETDMSQDPEAFFAWITITKHTAILDGPA